jgi:hypothetical protein
MWLFAFRGGDAPTAGAAVLVTPLPIRPTLHNEPRDGLAQDRHRCLEAGEVAEAASVALLETGAQFAAVQGVHHRPDSFADFVDLVPWNLED